MLLYDDTVILDIIKHYLAHSYLRPDCPLSYVVNLVMDRYVRNPSLPKIMWEIMKIEDLENADLWKEWVADQESKATNFIEWGLRVYEAEQNNIDRPSILALWFGEARCQWVCWTRCTETYNVRHVKWITTESPSPLSGTISLITARPQRQLSWNS